MGYGYVSRLPLRLVPIEGRELVVVPSQTIRGVVRPAFGTDWWRRDRLLKAVCKLHAITREELVGPARQRRLVPARQDAMYRLVVVMGMSYSAVGRILKRDHSTVVHGAVAHAKRNDLPLPPHLYTAPRPRAVLLLLPPPSPTNRPGVLP